MPLFASFFRLNNCRVTFCLRGKNMILFKIEMGQGIIVKGDVGVCTSALYSCSFIAGYNCVTFAAGAFHHPGGALSSKDKEDRLAASAMEEWIKDLSPSEVVQISGDIAQDRGQLTDWLLRFCPTVTTRISMDAVMRLTPRFKAGSRRDLNRDHEKGYRSPFDLSKEVGGVEKRPAGSYRDYGGFKLYGKNLMPPPARRPDKFANFNFDVVDL
jgi:hypothetical protein